MPAIPLGRIATGGHLDLLQAGLRRIQERLVRRELEISTGNRVHKPSDDPLAAVRALGYRTGIERADQYLRNISLGLGELDAVDGALGALATIAARAKEILLSQVGDTATPQTRANSAIEVQNLLEEAVSIANRRFGNRHLFGGGDGLKPPVSMAGSFAVFNAGALVEPDVIIGRSVSIPRSAGGADAFGALSAEILGRADLDPRATASTKLADLSGGAGVRTGRIEVADGLGGTAIIDLSAAESLGDVIDLVNATGLVTASISAAGNGLELAATGGNITVAEVEGGRTASDLGILNTSGAGAVLTGGDVDPRLRSTTLLADLRGGLGIDPAGFTIRNGPIDLTASLAGAVTVEDLLNRINSGGAHVLAAINERGDGLDLRSTLSGARLSVAEGSGTTATELGFILDFADVALDRLNGGLGVSRELGDDLRFTQHDGNTIAVDISSAATVQDVLDLINNDPENPGTLVASVVPGMEAIQIVDGSAGAGDLVIESVGGSFAAENLGIDGRIANPGTTLVGRALDVAGVQVDSIFNALVALRDALAGDDRSVLGLLGGVLEGAADRLLDARADAGARAQRLEGARSRFEEEKIQLEELISTDRGADLAEAVADFQEQQMVLQASYAVTSRILSLSLLDFLR